MVIGLESAVNGMIGIQNWNDVITNNLANVNTPGFKSSMLAFKNIQNMAINQRLPNSSDSEYIGTLSAGGIVDSTMLDMKQGAIQVTGNKLDLAISGKGFFTVQTPNGIAYTRNGSFIKNTDGLLTTTDGYPVLGEKGPININSQSSTNINIASDGNIYIDKNQLDKLKIVDFKNPSALQSVGNSLLKPAGKDITIDTKQYQITQGALEQANSNVVECMVNSINGSRTYETLAKNIETINKTLTKAVNQVGQVKK